MKRIGKLILARKRGVVTLTVIAKDLVSGLVMKPNFAVRSLHFGTKVRGQNIRKGEGYGWDGRDHVRARRIGKHLWRMTIPVRDNDPKRETRLFVKGNCYVRTVHNEIYYFDLRSWDIAPQAAIARDGYGGGIIEMDVENIPVV